MTDEAIEGKREKTRLRVQRHRERKQVTLGNARNARATNLANNEIDSRLAAAIRERAKAMAQVSKLVHWQDRLARLEQEINSLIGFQQRLAGRDGPNLMPPSRELPYLPVPERTFSPFAPIPDGVSSIPAGVKEAKVTASHGNVADMAREGGFE